MLYNIIYNFKYLFFFNLGTLKPERYSKSVTKYSAKLFRAILFTIPSFHTIPIELSMKPSENLFYPGPSPSGYRVVRW